MFELLPKLTKDYITNHISQEQIFEFYLGIPVEVGVKLNSPLRQGDNDPSFEFKYNQYGRLRAIDYGGRGFNGDCFDVVGLKYHVNPRDRVGFSKILEYIARDFRIHKYADGTYKNAILTNPEYQFYKKSKLRFTCEVRKWSHYDTTWWNIRVTEEALNKASVVPIQLLFVNDDSIPIYSYSPYDPCYGYYIGRNPEGEHEWKFYFPNRKKGNKKYPRFLSNSSAIQGLRQIKKAKIGVITKSYKDVIALKKFKIGDSFIEAVAPAAEGILLSERQIAYLRRFWDYIIINYDADPTGLHMMWLHRYHYGLTPMYFMNDTWNSKISYPIKDFYDFVLDTKNDLHVQGFIDNLVNQLQIEI